MSNTLNIELLAGFGVLLVAAAVAFGVISSKMRARNAASRRAHLKGRAREL